MKRGRKPWQLGNGEKSTRHFRYDPKANYLSTVVNTSRSVAPQVLCRPVFWIFLMLHLLLRVSHFLRGIDGITSNVEIHWHELGMISAITTFFEVFYTNQCYSRYMEMYEENRGLFDHISEVCLLLYVHVTPHSHQHSRLCARYLIASMAVFFSELDGDVGEDELSELTRLGLLSPEEQEFLRQQSHSEGLDRATCIIQWSADVAARGIEIATHSTKPPPIYKLPANLLKEIVGKILHVRELQFETRNTMDLPVPYPYFHLLTMMIVVNLFLWAYALGVSNSSYSTPVFIFASLIFIGMMELGSQLANPYGDDEVDFPVNAWLSDAVQDAAHILERETPGSSDSWASILMNEKALPKDRQYINLQYFVDDDDGISACGRESQSRIFQRETSDNTRNMLARNAYVHLQPTLDTRISF